MKDEAIVTLYWNRDQRAIQETTIKYNHYLYTIAYAILNSREDSQECVNDTYLAAWQSMPDARPTNLKTYLSKIIRRKAIDIYRQHHAKKRDGYTVIVEDFEATFKDEHTPLDALHEKQLIHLINAFLQTLPKNERVIFIGRYYFFDTIQAISSYTKLSESNVKTQLYRTRQKLLKLLVNYPDLRSQSSEGAFAPLKKFGI